MKIVELVNDALLLRPPELDDAAALYAAVGESLASVGRWLSWCGPDYEFDDAVNWIVAGRRAWDQDESYPLFVFERTTGRLLGGCGLNEIDRPRLRANLGYWVRATAQGRGVATQAARLTARFGLEALGFMRLELIAARENRASQRVAEKLSAVREGLLRNRLRIHDVQHDAFAFSLVPADLKRGLGERE